MKNIQAAPGEAVGNFLTRALNDSRTLITTVIANHNEISIKIYPASCIQDLYDKYDLAKDLKKSKTLHRALADSF